MLLLLASLALGTNSARFPATAQKTKSAPLKATTTETAQSTKNTVLWDAWYTVKVGGGAAKPSHYAYYNDHVELQPGNRVFYQNRFWKREEGYVNEESLGALAINDDEVSPLFFNFQSNYRLSSLKIDGAATGGELTVRAHQGATDLPPVRRALQKKVIFSVFFPVWLSKRYPEMKVGQTVGFNTVLEDGLDQQWGTVSGFFRMENPDEFAKKTQSRKVFVHYRDQDSSWYILPSGVPVKIEMPKLGTLIEKVDSKDAAERFFKADVPSDGG